VSLVDAISILDAAGCPGAESLLLCLFTGEETALAWMDGTAIRFVGELFRRMPHELVNQLGDNLDELRPRWANGTAKLLARTLSQHVAELARRGEAIGDQRAII
jgi:hypothetical protein